eukprot:752577-Hanusia_phi.AAC.1
MTRGDRSGARWKVHFFSLLCLLSSSICKQGGGDPYMASWRSEASASALELRGGGPGKNLRNERHKEEDWEADGLEEIEQYGM